MLKRIIAVFLIVSLLFLGTFYLHNSLIDITTLKFSLFGVYLYHPSSVVVIYTLVEFVAKYLPTQAGYAYLMCMLFKIGVFVLLFQDSVFKDVVLTKADKIGLIAPLFLFLIAEAIAVAKLLNSK